MRKNIGFLLNIHNRQFKIQMLVMHMFSLWFFYIVLLSWRTVTINLQSLSYTTTQNVKIKPPIYRIDPMQFGLSPLAVNMSILFPDSFVVIYR